MTAVVDAGGFTLSGPVSAPEWSTRFRVIGLNRAGVASTWTGGQAVFDDQRLAWNGSGLTVEYLLGEEGLRQNFILNDRPSGCGTLSVDLAVKTALCGVTEGRTGCVFTGTDGNLRHAYRDLKAWDACGTPLLASMYWDQVDEVLSLIVEDEGASYPITIDPVSTTANRILSQAVGSRFGWTPANAGDLNGDGYSDIAVGAPPLAAEGTVYVYYGSATGIGSAPDVTLKSGVAFTDNFGLGLDGAGDVNNDGYSDLVVGASAWTDNAATTNEGALFVYHGSATGISTVPDYILQTNTATCYLGFSVAGVGDINGDGYSDVVGGGWLAALPTTDEGGAWVFLGSPTGLNPTFRHRLERNQGNAQFGFTVAAAGDVNGDGYSDVVIGAPKATINATQDGAVYVYLGSANALGAGLNPAAASIFNTFGYSRRTANSVSTAGDVNADGYSDIIVGDWRDSIGGQAFEGTAFIYHGSATGINTVPATILQPNIAQAYLGRSVSTAGDVNGDGYADVVIGCIQYTNGQTFEGAAFLHLGSATGVNSSPFLRYEGNAINAGMGEGVSGAGDVNGDGYSDFIVGVPNRAQAYIYHGGTYSVNSVPSFTRSSGSSGAHLGTSVANAGDVNGDGYSDAIMGAPDASSGQANEGLAFVHHGSATGLAPLPSSTLQADVSGAHFGASVASAGDVNGDGYADVIIGAPDSGVGGMAYVHHGSPAGLSLVPAFTITGASGARLGASVSKAGDFNVDGYSDILVGAPGLDEVHLFFGSPTGIFPSDTLIIAPTPGSQFGAAVGTAGDVNGDGYSDIVIGAPAASNIQSGGGAAYIYHGVIHHFSGLPNMSIPATQAGGAMGTSVAGAGDVNGDGYSEVMIGIPFASSGETNEGLANIYRGSPSGTLLAAPYVLQANSVGANLGMSVAEAGDVNGDGYADICAGAPNFSGGEASEGRVYVALGSATGPAAPTTLETNIAGNNLGTGVAGGGDVDGDGYSDVIGGAPNAAPTIIGEGSVLLYRGNNALSINRLTRQYMTDLVSPLATNGADMSDEFFFGIGHRARSSIHRTTAKLRWEVVHEGQSFTGSPITNSVAYTANGATWTDLGLTGIQIKELVAKAPTFFRHKWRVRVEYPLHKMIDGQRFSRWFYGYASAVGDIGVLPVELLRFDGLVLAEGNQLDWSTGSETRSSHFLIERSADGVLFNPVSTLNAAGESSSLRTYTWLDTDAPSGLSYYRLRMVDLSGDEEFSKTIALVRDAKSITLYPVPVDDAINWTATDLLPSRAIIRDALGRIVMDASPTGNGLQGRSVQQLATGTYTLLLFNAEGSIAARSRFLKR